MPTIQRRPKKHRKTDLAVEDVFEFFLAFDHEQPRQFTKILRASLPVWAELYQADPEGLARQASMLVDWCRKCGVKIPGWLKPWKDSNPWDRPEPAPAAEQLEAVPPPDPGERTN